jgi:hypothetical protein
MIRHLQRIITQFSVITGGFAPPAPPLVTGDAIVTDSGRTLIDASNTIVADAIYVVSSNGDTLTDGTNLINHIRHG